MTQSLSVIIEQISTNPNLTILYVNDDLICAKCEKNIWY